MLTSKDENGKIHYINAIRLMYNCDYSLVVLDAEAILAEYESTGKFSTRCLHCCNQRVDEAIDLDLTEEEKGQVCVLRDGIPYLVIGNGQTFLESVHFEEDWLPPK